MIGITNLSKNFGEQTLFEDVTVQLNAGCRYGLVGANGSGKTTFLSILAGDEPESFGEVALPRNARLGVLRQDTFMSDEQLILNVAMMGDESQLTANAMGAAHRSEWDPFVTRVSHDPWALSR